MARVTGADTVQRNLQAYDRRFPGALRVALGRGAARVTARMQAEAPWQDRTGAARRGLHADVLESAAGFAVRAAHGVPYGLFLETAHQGRFRILWVLRDEWPSILRDAARTAQETRT